MTKRDMDLLNAIIKLTAERRLSPTVRELCVELSLSSPATVHMHLGRLKKCGKITWIPRSPRTIMVVEEAA